MKFDKIIWKLFKIDRSDFNKFNRQVEKHLQEVFEKGKEQGKKEERNRLKAVLK